MNSRPMLGIMTTKTSGNPPFPEKGFFKLLIQRGHSEGIPIIVFHPDSIHLASNMVMGYSLDPAGAWKKYQVPLPPYIYDRCFYLNSSLYRRYKPHIDRLKKKTDIQFIGLGLKGKWQIYEIVSKHSTLANYLPETEILKDIRQLREWMFRHNSVIIKPVNGSLGAGIMKLTLNRENTIFVEGRDRKNQSYSKKYPSLSSFWNSMGASLRNAKFLIQPYLQLTSRQGDPFDLRILVQKDGTGKWATTGKAIRVGKKGSITSNLHGGGRAYPFDNFLKNNYSPEKIPKIIDRISELERLLPSYLEQHHGVLVELGIDVGIDRDGKVWLIEANSKPGRKIFHYLNEKDTIMQAHLNPLYYVKHLIQSRVGG